MENTVAKRAPVHLQQKGKSYEIPPLPEPLEADPTNVEEL
jgi:hypothetical protein